MSLINKDELYILASYDISESSKRLRKIAKLMINYGKRVQKSVFECRLSHRQFIEMKEKADKIIDFNIDSVRYYTLCKKCQENIGISGLGTVTEDENVIIV